VALHDVARSGRQGWPSLARASHATVARPRLDGREHGVIVIAGGRPATALKPPPFNGCYSVDFSIDGIVDR
jgi:hypothetical protein